VSAPGDARAPTELASSSWRVLRSRDFGGYFLGSALSNVGTWFQNIAAGLLVYELTRSSLAVGAVTAAQFLGAFVLAPWAGAAADRFDRRRLLLGTQALAASVAAVLAVLTALGAATAPVVIGASAILGLSTAFAVPALMSLVPSLVEPRDLEVAVSLNSVTFNLARAVGPVLGALAVEEAGYAVAFAVNAGSFLAFAAALVVIRTRPAPDAATRSAGPRPRLRESVRLVTSHRTWTALLLAVAALSLSTDPINTVVPEYALDVLGGSERDAGLLVGAFGAGATATALLLGRRLRGWPRALPIAMVVQSLGMLGFAVARDLPIAMVALAVSGAGYLAGVTGATARVQREVPDAQLGRVMALWSLAFVGTRPFGAAIDGVLAQRFGPRWAAAALALPVLLGALLLARRLVGPSPGEPAQLESVEAR
jgi:MFS family permease